MSRSMGTSMRLIDLVAEGYDTLPELAKAAEYPKSTAYRLLTVLEQHGWLRRAGNRYELGFRILELAGQLQASLQLPVLARPLMEKAAAAAQETVHLGQLEGARIVYIEKVSGGRGFEMASRELGGARFAEEAFREPSADTIAQLHQLSTPRAATA